jgi:hypothetical protein
MVIARGRAWPPSPAGSSSLLLGLLKVTPFQELKLPDPSQFRGLRARQDLTKAQAWTLDARHDARAPHYSDLHY